MFTFEYVQQRNMPRIFAILQWCVGVLVVGAALFSSAVSAQPDSSSIRPLRTAPSEKFAVKLGFRDWGPATVAGQTILAGTPNGSGGLHAIDMSSGKLKWTSRPVNSGRFVSTAPAIFRNLVIAPFNSDNPPGAVIGLALDTGKEVWRGPDPAVDASVTVHAGLAYVLGKDANFYALDAASGREIWKMKFSSRTAVCVSRTLVFDDTLYLTGSIDTPDKSGPILANYFLFALDAKTGQERWRYRAEAPYVYKGVCLRQPVVTADTIFATGDNYIYGVDRLSGKDRWKPVEVRRPVEGRDRAIEVYGLVDAGSVLVGVNKGYLLAFAKASGQIAWEIAGEFLEDRPATAVAGNTLYFQGNPGLKSGLSTLHALDLDSHDILWSFARPTRPPNWPFGHVKPVDGGLWVDSYQAIVKLQ
jgi:outer membrane protein assembly factor BamB